jgi:chemotaxis protein histidine kinase CheA
VASAPPRRAGLLRYLREAFLYRWNLLAVLGGAAAAALAPYPDVTIPLLAAAELTYLAGLVAMPRFRKAIDARQHAARAQAGARQAGATLEQLLLNLSAEGRHRFEALRERCVRMRHLAQGVRGRSGSGEGSGEEIRTPALDRMLWVFLRLLHSRDALGHFLRATPESELTGRVDSLGRELEAAKAGGDERIARSLTDSLASAQIRLDNWRKAQQNARFVAVELDRIEQKIHALSELAVNRQAPDALSSQVDSAAESVRQTEKTIGELQSITGLVEDLDEPPAILEADLEWVLKR